MMFPILYKAMHTLNKRIITFGEVFIVRYEIIIKGSGIVVRFMGPPCL